MVATHRDPCPLCGVPVGAPVLGRPHVCEPAGRDLIVVRARVLRRIRARRRATVGVAAVCVSVPAAAIWVAWAAGGGVLAGLAASLVVAFAFSSAVTMASHAPHGWWPDVFGLTDVDAEVEP